MFERMLAVASVVGSLFFLAPVLANEPALENEGGRYTFNKVTDGFVRLDTQTGEVSVCGRRAVGWACQAAPEDRAVLESEIARLRGENAVLKKDILSRGLPLPAGALPEPVIGDNEQAPRWDGHSDLDRMMAFVKRVWHRLVDAIARAQRPAPNKS